MKLLNSVGSSLFFLSALLLPGTTATSPAQAQNALLCSRGTVCIYPEGASILSGPTVSYYRYGTTKLYNQYNEHYVYNNQTGGALAALCKNSNGTNCPIVIAAGRSLKINLTPYNSIKLIKP
ncbi:hypothetical protein [Nostoc sp.]|uniref:hypothetical protein n=1 Tax=Nostoc sp. TaxID=1180 RepID=UPI002FF46F67